MKTEDPPTMEEIEVVKKKHSRLLRAAQSMLPLAMEIGDWFLEAKKRVEPKKWYAWLEANFAEITPQTIATYARLAKNRGFLEAKFQIENQTFDSEDCFEHIPTIQQAVAAIVEENRIKKLANEPIEVEATVNGGSGKLPQLPDTGRGHLFLHHEPATIIAAEEAGIPIEDRTKQPESIFHSKLRSIANEMERVAINLEALVDYAKAARFSPEEIKWTIDSVTDDRAPELAKIFNVLLLGDKPVRPRLWQLFVKRKLASML